MDAGIGGGDCTGGDDVDGTGGVDDDGYDYPSIMFLDLHLVSSNNFSLFSSLPGVLTPVRGESLKILNGFDVSLPVSHSLWSSQSFGHQKGACPWLTENHFNSQYMKHWASQSFGT
ncbi:hypothetical protein Tco_0980148 [Tanacetum coccineum]